MKAAEISEEISFLLAVKDSVSDKDAHYQSIVSYMIDTMFEDCHDEILARAVSGSLEPIAENIV